MTISIRSKTWLGVALTLTLTLTLAACSSGPKPTDWQLEAKGAMERSVAAYLEGNSRVEAVEFARARVEISPQRRSDPWKAMHSPRETQTE